jgi:hypothetical protein
LNGLIRLYLKELREHRLLLGGTVGTIACLYGYVLVGVEGEASTFLLASFPISITTATLTFALLSAFWGEWKGSTHYLLLSLPVSRVAIPLSKYLSVLTAGLIVYLMAVLSILGLQVPLETSTQILQQFQLDPKTLMIFFCTQSFAWLIMLLGVVVGSVSLRYSFPRAPSLTIVAFLILVFICYLYFLRPFASLFGEEVGFFRAQILYTFTLGGLITIGGLVLFEKRAEI